MKQTPTTILLCCAFPAEMKYAAPFFTGQKNLHVQKLITGIGVVPACLSLAQYAQKQNAPDIILNIGICGWLVDDLPNLIQALRITHAATGAEVFADHLTDLPVYDLCTVDQKAEAGQNFTASCVDMEAFGIVSAAKRLFPNTPCGVFKLPYDHVPTGTIRTASFEELFAACAPMFATITSSLRPTQSRVYDTTRIERMYHCSFQTKKMLQDFFFLSELRGHTQAQIEQLILQECNKGQTVAQALIQLGKKG